VHVDRRREGGADRGRVGRTARARDVDVGAERTGRDLTGRGRAAGAGNVQRREGAAGESAGRRRPEGNGFTLSSQNLDGFTLQIQRTFMNHLRGDTSCFWSHYFRLFSPVFYLLFHPSLTVLCSIGHWSILSLKRKVPL
jgi:hypothetical protein